MNKISPRRRTSVSGLYGSSRAWYISTLAQSWKDILVIARNTGSMWQLKQDLTFFLPSPPQILPPWDTLPFEGVSPQLSTQAERLRTLLYTGTRQQPNANTSRVILTSPRALLRKVPNKEVLEDLTFTIQSGDTICRETLIKRFLESGFERRERVTELGDFAIRGEVIDCFTSSYELPVRLEFFDTEVEQIRLFSVETQRTVLSIDAVNVLPIRELIHPTLSKHITKNAQRAIKERCSSLQLKVQEKQNLVSRVEEGVLFSGFENLTPYLTHKLSDPLEYFSENTLVVFDDETSINIDLDTFEDNIVERAKRFTQERCFFPEPEKVFINSEALQKNLAAFPSFHLDDLSFSDDSSSKNETIRTKTLGELQISIRGRDSSLGLDVLAQFLRGRIDEGFNIAIVAGTQGRIGQLKKLLSEHELAVTAYPGSGDHWLKNKRPPRISLIEGSISKGIEITDHRVILISEDEIFHKKSQKHAKIVTAGQRRINSTLNQLRENDLVVHIDYGIGEYLGLKHLTVEGFVGDFLQIRYADSTLLLPVQRISKIHKYTSPRESIPRLDKLSSTRWVKTRQKVKESIAALAGDLVKLYATRSVSQGWRYEPWGAADEQFSLEFPYTETPDQMQAIKETVEDMADAKPMDRLICGDVGFGKTEVAVRAAFKCIQHARQVAVLVPTTVLVEQHAKTFRDRFIGHPVEVGAISRFYSAKENKAVLAQVKSGKVDIIIGTHKLLGKNIEFKDLGLVIIDEDLRFGVKQKERFKQLKTKSDFLTLTATPIPRTLHMSLSGIRDVSVISTPPPKRQVIKTFIARESDTLIRDVLLREIDRGGQAFFIHNRVQSIQLIAQQIKDVVPEAKVEFAHGQMTSHELESIMARFVDKEFNILVSTTIIENGIDIPDANTIIVYNAHMFGLAQLYQLRGRVGRSDRQAYAYFLTPPAKRLTGHARERLKVLQSIDELGVGFNLAMRDLEIRGAGNLLGKEQSGHVFTVGYELYSKILKEAVQHLTRGDEHDDVFNTIDPEVNLQLIAFIPDAYIPDISERLILYQRLSDLRDSEHAETLYEEIVDRFGSLPPQAEAFIAVMKLRAKLRKIGVVKAERKGTHLVLSLSEKTTLNTDALIKMIQNRPDKYKLSGQNTLTVTDYFSGQENLCAQELCENVEEYLHSLEKHNSQ